MANDREWQRRSDDWVKASHASRKRKEQARREALSQRYRHPALAAPKLDNSRTGGHSSQEKPERRASSRGSRMPS